MSDKPRCKATNQKGQPCPNSCIRDTRGKRVVGKPVPWLPYCFMHVSKYMKFNPPTKAEKAAKKASSDNEEKAPQALYFNRGQVLELVRAMDEQELVRVGIERFGENWRVVGPPMLGPEQIKHESDLSVAGQRQVNMSQELRRLGIR